MVFSCPASSKPPFPTALLPTSSMASCVPCLGVAPCFSVATCARYAKKHTLKTPNPKPKSNYHPVALLPDGAAIASLPDGFWRAGCHCFCHWAALRSGLVWTQHRVRVRLKCINSFLKHDNTSVLSLQATCGLCTGTSWCGCLWLWSTLLQVRVLNSIHTAHRSRL